MAWSCGGSPQFPDDFCGGHVKRHFCGETACLRNLLILVQDAENHVQLWIGGDEATKKSGQTHRQSDPLQNLHLAPLQEGHEDPHGTLNQVCRHGPHIIVIPHCNM